MLKVRAMPPPADPDLLARLRAVDPTTIVHFRHYGFVDLQVRTLIPGRRVVGTAVTVCMPATLGQICAGGWIGDIWGANGRIDGLLAAQDEEFARWRK